MKYETFHGEHEAYLKLFNEEGREIAHLKLSRSANVLPSLVRGKERAREKMLAGRWQKGDAEREAAYYAHQCAIALVAVDDVKRRIRALFNLETLPIFWDEVYDLNTRERALWRLYTVYEIPRSVIQALRWNLPSR